MDQYWNYSELFIKMLDSWGLTTWNMLNKKYERWDLTDVIFNPPVGDSSILQVQSHIEPEFSSFPFNK